MAKTAAATAAVGFSLIMKTQVLAVLLAGCRHISIFLMLLLSFVVQSCFVDFP
ncbi:MAG: hypothetical protein JZU50_04150 [Desulfobulbaceae bacterium]|jgi:hypothetical protein|nr:hypothetical protein [Desulfobulbaceae bacterium]